MANPLEEHPTSVIVGSNGEKATSTSFAEDRLTQMQKSTLEKAIRLIYKVHGKVEAHNETGCEDDECLCSDITDDLEAIIKLLEKV